MRFSESLIQYLVNRLNKAEPFLLGQWLESLTSDELESLKLLSKEFFNGSESSFVDDILSVILTAVVAETRNNSVEMDPERVTEWGFTLATAASLESFRRKGYLDIFAPLSIDPHATNHIRVTELGMAESDRLHLNLH